MLGPVIQGERVRLEPPTTEMIPLFCRWFADREVTRYLHMRFVPSPKMEEEWLERASKDEHGVIWAIVVDGHTIGTTGIHEINWRHRRASTGIVIGERSEWGKGYGSETVRLRTRYAFTELNLEKLMTEVYEGNHASRRELEKAGYRQYGLARRHAFIEGEWHDAWLGEILRDEWSGMQE